MKSPVYPGIEMKKVNRMGVEIEYCPKSGGVWLDKGELEKLIELAANQSSYNDDESMAPQIGGSNSDSHRRGWDDEDDFDARSQPKKKRESFLGEIFDIF